MQDLPSSRRSLPSCDPLVLSWPPFTTLLMAFLMRFNSEGEGCSIRSDRRHSDDPYRLRTDIPSACPMLLVKLLTMTPVSHCASEGHASRRNACGALLPPCCSSRSEYVEVLCVVWGRCTGRTAVCLRYRPRRDFVIKQCSYTSKGRSTQRRATLGILSLHSQAVNTSVQERPTYCGEGMCGRHRSSMKAARPGIAFTAQTDVRPNPQTVVTNEQHPRASTTVRVHSQPKLPCIPFNCHATTLQHLSHSTHMAPPLSPAEAVAAGRPESTS